MMWGNINRTKKRMRFTTRLQAADCSLKSRKGAAKDPEAQQRYFAQISTSETRPRPDEKIQLSPGLTTKRNMI